MKMLSICSLFLNILTFITYGQSNLSGQTKPNILLICIDDLRPELPSFGKEYIKAPHMEKLFTEGRLFKRHYVQAPTCGSSRFAMLTGLYPDEPIQLSNRCIPAHDHQNLPTFPAHLKENGYFTAAVGKISHYPGNLTGKNWADENKPEIPNAWHSSIQSNGEWKHAEGLMHGYANGVAREIRVSPVIEAKDARYPDDATFDGFKQQLNLVTHQEKPWLLAVGLIRPHLPFACHTKYVDLYKNSELPAIPANKKPAKHEFWHPSGEYMKYVQKSDPRKDPAHADLVRKYYAACVTSSDDHVGQILALLKQANVDENTIVVLWGDHGWHLGEQKIWGKHSPYAVALHAPFYIKAPGMKQAGIASEEIVETLDLYPTLCDLVNINKPEHLEGKSLVNIINDPAAKSDGIALSYWKNLKSTITTDEHKITTWKTGKEGQLKQHYNLKTDPHETTNLVTEK